MKIAKRHQDVKAIGHRRDYNVHIRINHAASARLASLQGLCKAYGECESLGYLMENVCLPAIARYCEKYARKAAKRRNK